MLKYKELVQRILDEGERREDRTGVGTLSVFDHRLQFNLQHRFPLVTIKETRWRTAFLEMLWFLRGEDSTKWLKEHGCKLWDAWADEHGCLGPVYGVQWRSWLGMVGNFDQVATLIKGLRENPNGRRHLVSAWNVEDLPYMALPPCHWAHQCYVSNGNRLSMKVFIRSSDVALGLPFNIAQYALLLHLYARATGYTPYLLTVDLGDAHIYLNHVEAMREALQRPSLAVFSDFTKLVIDTDNIDIDGYKIEDFKIINYAHHPHIPLPVAV